MVKRPQQRAFWMAWDEACKLSRVGDTAGAIAVMVQYHAQRRAAAAQDAQDALDDPQEREHVDLLRTGPLGGPETAEEEAEADAALDALGARRRAEMAAGGDPYRADLLPDGDARTAPPADDAGEDDLGDW